MTDPNMTLLYVDSTPASRRFYSDLFGREPVEASPNFTLFVLESGYRLALWNRHAAQPPATADSGGAEVVFPAETAAAVDAVHAEWQGRGLTIIQPPTDMDFGRTFTAVDPDGHRLRVAWAG